MPTHYVKLQKTDQDKPIILRARSSDQRMAEKMEKIFGEIFKTVEMTVPAPEPEDPQ